MKVESSGERPSKIRLYSISFFQNSIDDLKAPNKTLKITTTHKIPSKFSDNTTHMVAVTPVKRHDGNSSSTQLTNSKKVVNLVTTKGPFRIKLNKITTTTTPPKQKWHMTTSVPIKIQLTRVPTKKSTTPPRVIIRSTQKPLSNKSPNIKITSTPTTKKKPKPTIQKIITKWADRPSVYEIKQNWYEPGVPYPNPNPEISSSSPSVSISDLASISPLSSPTGSSGEYPNPMPEISSYSPSYSISDVPSPVPDVSDFSPSSTPASTTAVSNPISVFNLDMAPDNTKDASGSGSPCPSVHISSSVLAPFQSRQDCSDLNLVINSHYHQTQNTRNPDPPVNTYDAEDSVEDEVGEGLDAAEDAPLEDPGVGSAADSGGGAPQAAPQAAAPPTPGAGGTGGTGGNGGNGSDGGGGLKFPDLKNLFEALGYIWNGLGSFFGFLRNPYLYLVPMALFFLIGLLATLGLFPWWIPILLLYLGVKTGKQKPKETVTFYKHVHKPVHHTDGWFWNHQTKTWQNVHDFIHKRSDDIKNDDDNVQEQIDKFGNKYRDDNASLRSWKRRKRSLGK